MEEVVITQSKRLKYLEGKFSTLEKKVDVETKYRERFEKHASYLGHGVYYWQGAKARDTRVLFIKGVLMMENRKFDNTYDD